MSTLALYPETADIETSSDGYAARFAGPIGAWLLSVQERATLQMLAAMPHARILDVGGGHGQLAGALAERGHAVTVLGSAEVCAARIRPLVDAGRCEFKVGNILDLPYPDQAFDVVLSYRLLSHVKQWPRFLAELARVACHAVILDYPSTRSINVVIPFLFRWKKQLEGNTRDFTLFSEGQLRDVFEPLEFKLAERYPQFFVPMVIHRILQSPRLSSLLEALPRTVGLTSLFGSPVIAKFVRQSGRQLL